MAPYTTLPIISNEFLSSVPISVPAQEVQEVAISRLDALSATVGELTAVLDRQITLLREHRQALISAAVAGDLDISNRAA
jgi:type I restriction enzyme S subunit